MTRVLALDLGSRRIGVAVSDAGGVLASPRPPVLRSGDRTADHVAIAALVAEEEAGSVVVGLPLSLDGSTGRAATLVLEEVGALRSTLAVPVELADERLTTVSAVRRLQARGVPAKRQRSVVDGEAAAVLLQAWLDRDGHHDGRSR